MKMKEERERRITRCELAHKVSQNGSWREEGMRQQECQESAGAALVPAAAIRGSSKSSKSKSKSTRSRSNEIGREKRKERLERLLRSLLPGLIDQFRVFSLAPPVTLGLTRFYTETVARSRAVFPPSQSSIHSRHNRSFVRPSYSWPTLLATKPIVPFIPSK